jgi:hypothetical protein
LTGVPPQRFSGTNAEVQLWERDTGHFPNDHDLIGELLAEYTDGKEKPAKINYNNGWAIYEITYVVNRPEPPTQQPPPQQPPPQQPPPQQPPTTDTAPTIDPIKPVTGSKIRNRSPLIAAKVSDAQTDLAQSNIKLFVDGKPITNFSYDAVTDRLSYQSGRLAHGGHTVKVEATDASGLKGENAWSFKVVRR